MVSNITEGFGILTRKFINGSPFFVIRVMLLWCNL